MSSQNRLTSVPRLIWQTQPVERLGKLFAEKVSRLAYVDRVLLELGTAPRIWTVIVAEPFNWAMREAVYDAQLAATEAYPDDAVDFRLINLNEFRGCSADDLLPANAIVLYKR